MLSASALTVLGSLAPFLVGTQAVLVMRDLDFGAAGVGLAVSVFFGAAALVTVLSTGTFERMSRRTGRAVSGALVAIGSLAVALIVRDLPGLALAMVVLGAGNAACQGTSNKTVASMLPPHRRGLGFGIKQAAVPTAIMLGGLAVPLTTTMLGWRSTFVATGCLGILVFGYALVDAFGEGVTRRQRHPPGEPREEAVRLRIRPSLHTSDLSDHAPLGPLALCAVAVGCASMACNFFGAYLAIWAHEAGLTIEQAGWLMACGAGTSVAVRVLSGLRADGRFGGNMSVVATMMLGGALALFGIGAVPELWGVILFGVLAFGVGWSWHGLMLFAVARVGRDAPTQAISVVQSGAFVGGAAGPALLGLVVEGVGFEWAWRAGGVLFVVSAALVLLARSGFRRDLLRRPPRSVFYFGGGRRRPRRVIGGAAEPTEDQNLD
ncbi:MFS transporter [Ornithinimicrobium cryptoxanthini]|uniref:MFS transporter n=1 Tax=Ornithinimicrobium cryptoxanthini TaxID=2934161 RepID=A0ABY4YM77_9MICO|nr:MFS transporter [Ornithinimicrobium cryptoxanthini]USQ77828.1 MFS transporter [Ornithinimicrobium cryptoxanthini]